MRLPRPQPRPNSDWVLQFINIVFLILVFFLANSVVAQRPSQDVVPPFAVQMDKTTFPQSSLQIDRFGGLRVGDHPASLSEFIAAARRTDQSGVIIVDKRLSALELLDVFNAFANEGIRAPAIMTLRGGP